MKVGIFVMVKDPSKSIVLIGGGLQIFDLHLAKPA
jgi:hypothetical protein